MNSFTSNDLVFCSDCRNDVMYNVSEVLLTGDIKGIKYQYKGKETRCVDCGALVLVPSINEENEKALNDVFRSKNNIINLDVIRAIPEKYAIGKRPLSLLLGWGELTFTRYYEGDTPTKQYAEILNRIYEEPAYYLEILEAGKGNLKSNAAYEKSKKAVIRLLGISNNENSNICTAVRYLLSKCEDITPLALQKALYYIQGFYYAFYNSYLFTENCEAWGQGPVYRDIYLQYRDYKFEPNLQKYTFEDKSLTASQKAVYDSVINNICCYSGKVLKSFTHNEAPWLNTRSDITSSAVSEPTIPREMIGNYFRAIKEKYNMVNPNDIRTYAYDMFMCN